MYNERNEGFSIKDIGIQLLFVVLFVFLLLWLFPTKGDVEKLADKGANGNVLVAQGGSYEQVFAENIYTMKETGKEYFTKDKIPTKIGDVVKITLSQMLDQKLLLPFLDADGKQCDISNSYLEVKKVKNENYIMKVVLECPKKSDYVEIPMGCYDFCERDICEIKDGVVVAKTTSSTSSSKAKVEYLYEYSKAIPATYTKWSNWSSWTLTSAKATKLLDVETKVEQEKEKVQYAVKRTVTKIPYATTEKVQIDTEVLISDKCTKYATALKDTGEVVYSQWIDKGILNFNYTPANTDTKYYVRVCPGSSYYKVFERESYTVKQGVKYCVEYGDFIINPVYINKNVTKYREEVKETPLYAYAMEDKTYYRTRTRSEVKATTDKKWSVYNATKLINDGYTYTGNKKVK